MGGAQLVLAAVPLGAVPVAHKGLIVVEVVHSDGRERVRPVGGGFKPWWVAFPRRLRVAGHRYAVAELRPQERPGRRGYYVAIRPFVRLNEVS
jgi:hypothetical protein